MNSAIPVITDEIFSGQQRRALSALEVVQNSRRMKLPISDVAIVARVVDRIAHVSLKQTFQNPFSEHLEAVYIFPLPGGCAVSSFKMKVGERIIEGLVQERQAARHQYDQALQEGKRAALLEQERDDIFTVQVGNLPPSEEITIEISYSEKLPYFDLGQCEIRLPLVVAPRHIPGAPLDKPAVGDGVELDTDLVPDASRISPPRLAAGARDSIDLDIKVELDQNGSVEDLTCSQHATRLSFGGDLVTVSLAKDNEIMDRDFILRWRMASKKVESNFIVCSSNVTQGQSTASDCYGMISLVAPINRGIVRPARDVIFVLDRSGSMQGLKMVSAARACSYLLATLGPHDRFAIQAFDDSFEWFQNSAGERYFQADESGIADGMNYLRKITARGGTQMYGALTEAIKLMNGRETSGTRMPVIVVLTDGQVGDESRLFKFVQKDLGENRVFTVGIDTAPNDGFLRRLSALGGGTASFVAPGEALEAALSHIGREIGQPLITDLKIEDGNSFVDKTSVAPAHFSDLFEGRAITAFFKISADGAKNLKKNKIKITGKYCDGSPFASELAGRNSDVPAISQLWAKAHIVDLEDQYRIADGQKQTEIKSRIIDAAVRHSLLTRFTAFVVVDHSEVVNKDGSRHKVIQPVHAPADWADFEDQAMPGQFFRSPATFGKGIQPARVSANSGWGAPASMSQYGAAPPHGDVSDSWNAMGRAWGAPADIESQSTTVQRLAAMPPVPPPVPPASPSSASSISRPLGSSPAQPSGAAPVPPQVPPMPPRPAVPPMSSPPSQPENTLTLSDMLRAAIGAEMASAKSSDNQNLADLQEQWDKFEKELSAVLKDISAGRLPDSKKLDAERVLLLKVLSASSMAFKLVVTQSYLRGELIKLLAALESAKVVSAELSELAHLQQEKFDQVVKEIANHLSHQSAPFWEATI